MRRHLVALALATAAVVSSDARADVNDLVLSRLARRVEQGGMVTAVIPQSRDLRALASQLGVVLAPHLLTPADTLGFGGVQFSVDLSTTQVDRDAAYWRAAEGSPDPDGTGGGKHTAGYLSTIGFFARKGMWFPAPAMELGGGAVHLKDSNMWAGQLYAKLALQEGYHDYPLASLALAGLCLGLRPGASALDRRASRILLLPLVGYQLFTIQTVHFVYTRFTLPLALLLLPPAGRLAARLWRPPGPWRPIARSLTLACIAYSGLYCLNVDLAMRADTRYAAEAWLRQALQPGSRLGLVGSEHYLPRTWRLGPIESERLLWEDSEAWDLEAWQPDWLILSSKSFVDLVGAEADARDRLLTGEAGYAVVWDQQQPAPLSWLPGAFVESRVSPRIVILRRDPDGLRAAPDAPTPAGRGP